MTVELNLGIDKKQNQKSGIEIDKIQTIPNPHLCLGGRLRSRTHENHQSLDMSIKHPFKEIVTVQMYDIVRTLD